MIIFKQIENIRKMPSHVREPALKNVNNSGWPLLPENFLYCMAASVELQPREIAIKKIIAIREGSASEGEPEKKGPGRPKIVKRIVQVSKVEVNENAENWWDLVNINIAGVEEPPLTRDIPTDDLKHALLWGISLDLPRDLPAHSQTVERCVKLVSEAAVCVFGQEQRHKHINAVLLCRKARPNFNTKSDYTSSF